MAPNFFPVFRNSVLLSSVIDQFQTLQAAASFTSLLHSRWLSKNLTRALPTPKPTT
jgi:hypothetical protein